MPYDFYVALYYGWVAMVEFWKVYHWIDFKTKIQRCIIELSMSIIIQNIHVIIQKYFSPDSKKVEMIILICYVDF